MRKTLTLITVLLGLALLLTPAFATASIVDSGTCGSNLTWSLTNTGVLTISGTGAMTDYSARNNCPPWQQYGLSNSSINITSIIINEGVTTIGSYAFDLSMTNLTSFSLPSTLTAVGFYASGLQRAAESDL